MHVRRLDLSAEQTRIAEVWRATWKATYHESLGAEALGSMLADLDGMEMDRPGVVALGVDVEGTLAATGFFREAGKVAYVWGMYVLPRFQRHGVGTSVLRAIAENLVAARYLEVRVLFSSEAAQTFYLKAGFREVGEEVTEIMRSISVPTRIMALDLLSPSGLALRTEQPTS